MTNFDPNMSAAEFFENVVPEIAAQKSRDLSAEQKAVSHSVAVVLTGAGGGEWTLTAEGGELTVSTGVADGANPVFELDVDLWKGLMTGERTMVGPKFDVDAIDVAHFKPDIVQKLGPISGTLLAVVEGDDEAEVLVKFGAGAPDEPTATIRVDEDTALSIADGSLNPQQAFMGGKVKILGDMALAMQVAALQM